MEKKIAYLKIQSELKGLNERIGQLRSLLYIREDKEVRSEFEQCIKESLNLNNELLKLQELIDNE